MSIDELFSDFHLKVKDLNQQLKGASQRESNLLQELTRISNMLKESRQAEAKFLQIAKDQEEISEELKHNFANSDKTIKDLQV